MRTFILYLTIFVLGALLLMSVRTCHHERQEAKRAKEIAQQAIKNGPAAPLVPVEIIRDTIFKTQIYTYRPTEIEHDDDLSIGISPAYVDSISRALDVSDKEIVDLTRINMKLKAKLQAYMEKDSAGRVWAAYSDRVFNIKYFPDSNLFDIKANPTLTLAGVKDRVNIFQQWQYESSDLIDDQRFVIYEFNHVQLNIPYWSSCSIYSVGFTGL